MKNIFNNTVLKIIIIFLAITLNSCEERDKLCFTVKSNYSKLYKFNEIGILGADSSNPYIEIQYTISNGTTNQVVTQWVKPPCLIGDYPVICNYDSVYSCASFSIIGFLQRVNIGYDVGNPEYMKIINHSNNVLEYFISGTQDTATISLNRINTANASVLLPSNRTLSTEPFIQYKNAPIYYLLHPDKKPKADLYKLYLNQDGKYIGKYNVITSLANPNQIGDLQVTKPWTIEDVMKLYRAEYKQSVDTILTFSLTTNAYGEEYNNPRLSTGNSDELVYISEKTSLTNNYKRPNQLKFYGYINAKDSLKASDNIPLITHYRYYNSEIR